MKEIISIITSKGQVTIPAEIRNDDEGVVRLRVPRYPTIASLRGAAGRLNKPISWKEIQKIAQEDRFNTKHESK